MIDKWSLYTLAQYCDEKVSDGRGGQEPRFTVNVYLQAQQDAFTVLQSLAAIFRAMSYWQGEQIVLDADLPKDPVYTFSRANVVDGEFSYTGTRARDRHTIAKVAWDNPEQKFKTEYEFVRDEAAIAKYGVKVLDLSIVGCTSQGQAQRAGLWALKSEQLETRTVTFKTGLDGFIPTVGSIINVSDEVLAGRANGGRVSAVSADLLTVTVDRDVVVSVGDTLIINADNGKAQRRIVSAVNGRNVTVSVAFDGVSSQNVWAVDSSDLKTMQFRVLSIKQDDVTFTITALQHEPQKYDAIDYGAIVEQTAISIIKPNIIDAPKNIVITQRNRVEQGQNVTTMIVSWEQVSAAVAYDVEWRKDNGNWIKVPRTGNNSIEIDGVYSGNYLARVAAVSAFDLVSNFATSILTAVAGKVGAPPTLANLKATGILFGMRLDWLFAQGSSDTNYTEIQVASAPDTNVALLGAYAYPTNTATINGLQGNLTQYYRARIVDKLGNASPWTTWVSGTTDADAQKVLDLLNGQITESQLYQDLGTKIDKIGTIETGLSQEIKDRVDAQAQEAIDRSNAINQETQSRIAAIKSVNDGITQEIIDRENGDTETLGVITTYKKSNDKAMAAVQSEIETIVDDQSAMSTKLDGVYAVVTPLTADSNQWTADSGSKQAAAWTLQSAYATADMALSQKIDNVSATYADNLALVVENYYTKATTNETIAQKISTFKSEVVDHELNKKADAGALEETTAKAKRIDGELQAVSIKLDGVYAKVTPLTADSNSWTADSGTKSATAWTLQSAIVDGDSALSQRIDNLDANFKDSAAEIETVNRTFADENKALSGRIDTLNTTMQEQSALVRKDIIAISDENTSLAGTVENIQRSNGVTTDGIEVIKAVGDVERVKAEASKLRLDANITELNSLKLQIDTSISKIDDLVKELNLKISKETNAEIIAEYQNQISDLQTKKAEAVAERDGIPARIAKLQSDKATIDSLVKTEIGIKSEYTIKMFGNNVIGGFGLALDKNNVFDFAIRADKFYIAPPDGTGKGVSPFMVLTSSQTINGTVVPAGTYIQSAYIHDGSIDVAKINKASITSLSALSANIGHFKSAESGARLEIKDSLLSVYDANNVLRVRLGLW